MNDFLKDLMAVVVQHGGTALGSCVVASGVATAAQGKEIEGAILVAVTVGFNLFDRWSKRRQIDDAKASLMVERIKRKT